MLAKIRHPAPFFLIVLSMFLKCYYYFHLRFPLPLALFTFCCRSLSPPCPQRLVFGSNSPLSQCLGCLCRSVAAGCLFDCAGRREVWGWVSGGQPTVVMGSGCLLEALHQNPPLTRPKSPSLMTHTHSSLSSFPVCSLSSLQSLSLPSAFLVFLFFLFFFYPQ